MENIVQVPTEDLAVDMVVLAVDPILVPDGVVGTITGIEESVTRHRYVMVTSDPETVQRFVAAPSDKPQNATFFTYAPPGIDVQAEAAAAANDEPSPVPPARAEEASEDVLSEHEPTPRASYTTPPPSPGRAASSNPASAMNTPARRGGRSGKQTRRRRVVRRLVRARSARLLR
jgi:hypothetical protein